MKAVRVIRPGSIDGLDVVDAPEQPLGRSDVRIRVRAASLNYRDLLIARGQYPGPLKDQPIPLSDGAGEVIEVGADVRRVAIGDRVAPSCFPRWIAGPMLAEYHHTSTGMTIDGLLAETAVYDESAFVHIPDDMSFAEAAALPCAAVSAWSALHVHEPLRAGHKVLVQGTGGVALFALQLAIAQGASVLAITSSPQRAELLREMGAEAVVDYNEHPDWHEQILALTGGDGVDKVVEIGGEKTIQKSVACTRLGGELGLVGFVTGFGGGLPPTDIMNRSVMLRGISIGPRQSFEAVLAVMASGNMRPKIGETFAFDDFASAYECIAASRHVGKIVINLP